MKRLAAAQAAVSRRMPAMPLPLRAALGRHKLALAIAGVIIVAVVQTVVSVTMYVNSTTYGLDLSRPEFARAKRQVKPNTPQASFAATGPVSPEVIDQFMKLYNEQSASLNGSGTYNGTPLSDVELRFEPNPAAPPQQ